MDGEPELWSGALDPPRHLRWRRGPKPGAPEGDAADLTVPEPDAASGDTEIRAARITPRTKTTPARSAAGRASAGGTAGTTSAAGARAGTTPAGATTRATPPAADERAQRARDASVAQHRPVTGSDLIGAGRRAAKRRRRAGRFLRRN
jgi:hypothetical protein